MNRDEAIRSLDESAGHIVHAFRELGIVACFVRGLDADQDFRLICLKTPLVRTLLENTANELKRRERELGA
jgi:hypothetical protein